MKFKTTLIHRCTVIHSGQITGQDPYGQDIYDDVKIENVSCRLDSLKNSRSPGETGTDYLTSYMLFFDADMKISMNMKVMDLKDKYGNSILPGEFITDQILPIYDRRKLHHFEVKLKQG